MDDKVNLAEKLALFDEHYSPKIIGHLNDYKLAVVKVLGAFVWHKHDTALAPTRRRRCCSSSRRAPSTPATRAAR